MKMGLRRRAYDNLALREAYLFQANETDILVTRDDVLNREIYKLPSKRPFCFSVRSFSFIFKKQRS